MANKISILIADDHPIVRRGLRTVIRTQTDMELVGEAENGMQAVQLAGELKPDIAIMDVQMPVMDGLSAIRELARTHSRTRCLVLTSFPDDERVLTAIKVGAAGVMLKDSAPKDLLNAVRRVAQGESALHPAIAHKVLLELQHPAKNNTEDVLTAREKQVLSLLALGMTNNEIAEELNVSVRTVTAHVRAILDKLHLSNRTQAALFAQEKGMGGVR